MHGLLQLTVVEGIPACAPILRGHVLGPHVGQELLVAALPADGDLALRVLVQHGPDHLPNHVEPPRGVDDEDLVGPLDVVALDDARALLEELLGVALELAEAAALDVHDCNGLGVVV
eukprot:CAMPEP_0194702616 /NCGR_PEP_ID=MMETSP0295-20121207/27003_1 /TAXON_ID=39354 /ORGANISM="Heterosigma akashiwo, Strain CCMP2393" /LENGTH=116 /DNA_ID=CAMNT_0039597263 /DNA_START=36 /DNA_END=383 /DNA_ORIENTATION=-